MGFIQITISELKLKEKKRELIEKKQIVLVLIHAEICRKKWACSNLDDWKIEPRISSRIGMKTEIMNQKS